MGNSIIRIKSITSLLCWLFFLLAALQGTPSVAATSPCVTQLQALVPGNEGYAILDTAAFFSLNDAQALFHSFPAEINYELKIFSASDLRPGDAEFQFHFNRFPMPPQAQTKFTEYLVWLDQELKKALQGEEIELDRIEFRKWTVAQARAHHLRKDAGSEWHRDGLYLTVSIALLGEATEVMAPSRQMIQADEGETIVLSNKDRAQIPGVQATLHRTPQLSSARLLVLIRYKKKSP